MTILDDNQAEARADQATSATEEFIGRMLGIWNDSATALLLSVGYRTGLFDTMARLPAATSEQIADAAGLDERYVREWLAGLTTAGVLTYDPTAKSYALPEAYVPVLSTAGGPDNLSRMMMFVALLGSVEDKVVECFRTGGGLAYDDFPRFHDVMAEDSGAVFDAALVDVVLPLTGVLDRLQDGIDVADIGTGRGHAVNVMAKAFPESRFVGYDFAEEALATGRAEAAAYGLDNARFTYRDVAEIGESSTYDLITAFDAIHDQAHPAAVLDGIYEALRPGGTFLMVDIAASSKVENNVGLPWATMIYTISTFHCMSVSLGLDGAGLGTAWGEELATEMLHTAGFVDVDVHRLEADPFNLYFVARKGDA